ncbi:MAG: hypothetical protein N3D11_13145 [Candidatus Sumerlaeia bacterium]|nr:hypothetical protein [Candidatus Sumerlaeia bacterium]
MTWFFDEGHEVVLPFRVKIVESDVIIRGARQSPWVLRRVLNKYNIRTIINLDDRVLERQNLDRPDADPYAKEKAIAAETGVRYFGFLWQGSGIGPYEEYDMAADILASSETRPVFVHCAAGQKRTNAALAAYWIRHKGYTLEQTVEGLKAYGLVPEQKPDFMKHLAGYFEYTRQHPRPSPPITLPVPHPNPMETRSARRN